MSETSVVVIGNCQGVVITDMLSRAFIKHPNISVTALQSYTRLTADEKNTLANADILLAQKGEFSDDVITQAQDRAAQSISFPSCMQNCLWPYHAEAHYLNADMEGFNSGPFPKQTGVRWMNQRLLDGEAPDRVADDYINLDISKVMNLDRLYEIGKRRMQALDNSCDVGGQWDVTSSMFTDARTFHASLHPINALLETLVQQILPHIMPDEAELAPWRLTHEAFEPTQPPVHPSIARHYGLKWASETTTYRFWNEGEFTHDEWVCKYVHFAVDADLARIVSRYRAGDRSDDLVRALEDKYNEKPEAYPVALLMASEALRQSRVDDGLSIIEKVLDTRPDYIEALLIKGRAYLQARDMEKASAIFIDCLRLEPNHYAAMYWRAQTLHAMGSFEAALIHMKKATELKYNAYQAWEFIGKIHLKKKRKKKAISAFETAKAFHPNPEHFNSLIREARMII